MQSRSQKRRRILQQATSKKYKMESNQEVKIKQKQVEEDDFEDVSQDSMEPDDKEEFEDEYDDEYEMEEGSIDIDSDEGEILKQQMEEDEQATETQLKRKGKQAQEDTKKRVWFFDQEDVDNLDYDNRAYNMLHRVNTEWPCLSCDFVLPEAELEMYKQKQFQEMKKYPYTVYLAAGTQAAQTSKNQIYLLKLARLHKTKYDDDESQQDEDSEDDNDSNDEEGEVGLVSVTGLKYGVNRIKTMNHRPIVAYWSESTDVTIVDITPLYKGLDDPKKKTYNINQLTHKSFKNPTEGFALDWSNMTLGQLATGGQDAKVQIYNLNQSDWIRDIKPYNYHKASVEDIQFSPVEAFAFASCSVDGTVGVVDLREGKKNQAQIQFKAHDCDVNVLSWNQVSTHLLATGADDGCFKVWDLRYPGNDAISEIQFHNKPITSIQFQPNSDSTLAVSSADNKLTIWDFAVENEQHDEEGIPDQLMFVHQGQKDLKEIRYHPIYFEMLCSTSANGFNVFKPTLDQESDSESEDDEKGPIPTIKEEDLDQYFGKMQIQ